MSDHSQTVDYQAAHTGITETGAQLHDISGSNHHHSHSIVAGGFDEMS